VAVAGAPWAHRSGQPVAPAFGVWEVESALEGRRAFRLETDRGDAVRSPQRGALEVEARYQRHPARRSRS
jgi:hypothetical protein